MPTLVWDRPGSRRYEHGLDRGVLFLPNGKAVPWNGLTNVKENSMRDSEPIYYDGMKVGESIDVGEFSATMSAITYPEEFEWIEGNEYLRNGVMVTEQMPQTFALSYRTMIGNDLGGDCHYKIHILYNLTATPSDKTYASASDTPEIVEFEWTLSATPEEIPGIRPTAHIILDTRKLDRWLLEDLELMLYGGSFAEATLMAMPEFVEFLKNWYRVKIDDNGDGTWTATEQRPGFIHMVDDDEFQIIKINASYIDEDTFVITDTSDSSDMPRIEILDNGDGTWTASTDDDNVIVMVDEGTFEIRSIDVSFAGPDMYRISSMHSEN